MPRGLQRFHASGQTHFVTFCCYHRRDLFSAAAPREVFEAGLGGWPIQAALWLEWVRESLLPRNGNGGKIILRSQTQGDFGSILPETFVSESRGSHSCAKNAQEWATHLDEMHAKTGTCVGHPPTQTFNSPSGPFQVHFYMNPTMQIFYGLDYKTMFLNMGN